MTLKALSRKAFLVAALCFAMPTMANQSWGGVNKR